MSKEPRENQILFIDLGFRTKLYLIFKIDRFEKEERVFFCLYLLPITSKEIEEEAEKEDEIEKDEEKEEKKEEQRTSIRQYKIRLLPDCMEIDPSFIRYHNYVDLMNIERDELSKFLCKNCPKGCLKQPEYKNQNEYDFIVEKHKNYRNDKLNALKIQEPFKVDWSKRKKKNSS